MDVSIENVINNMTDVDLDNVLLALDKYSESMRKYNEYVAYNGPTINISSGTSTVPNTFVDLNRSAGGMYDGVGIRWPVETSTIPYASEYSFNQRVPGWRHVDKPQICFRCKEPLDANGGYIEIKRDWQTSNLQDPIWQGCHKCFDKLVNSIIPLDEALGLLAQVQRYICALAKQPDAERLREIMNKHAEELSALDSELHRTLGNGPKRRKTEQDT